MSELARCQKFEAVAPNLVKFIIAPRNPSRSLLYINNTSTSDLNVRLGDPADNTPPNDEETGFTVPAGQVWEMPRIWPGMITAKFLAAAPGTFAYLNEASNG